MADEIDSGDDGGGNNGAPPDRAAAGKSYLPSPTGLSVLVAPDVEQLEACVVANIRGWACAWVARDLTRRRRPQAGRAAKAAPCRSNASRLGP